MKTSTATIRLVQKLNRKNKNGEYPIYLVVCFHGRLEKACGISCLEKYWDKRNECVRKSCPNAAVLNKMLFDIKQKVISRKNEYELNNRVYTPSMLLSDNNSDTSISLNSNVYKDIMEYMIVEKRMGKSTTLSHRYAYSKLVEFFGRDNFLIDEINLGLIKDFADWLNVGDCTKHWLLLRVGAIWNYAVLKRLVDYYANPFREFNLSKYKIGQRDYFIDAINIKKLMDYFLDLVIERNGSRWSYREGALERLHSRTSYEFGIMWFLLCYKLNGSAPVEIGLLRCENCERIMINGEDYWKVEFKRQKTKSVVNVRWKRDIFSIIALEHFMGMSKNGMVYPICSDAILSTSNIDRMIKSTQRYATKAIEAVRRAFKVINEETIRSNVEKGLNEPLVDVDKVVMYTARHSLANHLLNDPNVSVRELASILSRSPNTISQYIHELSKDVEIASVASSMAI